ncbi:unnamed protein product [Ectocarpus sp. 12 AP-2014]
MATDQDRANGVGAFYDELGCAGAQSGTGFVGCSLGDVPNCRLCVFHRALYSQTVLNGEEVPFVDCPCCVPEVYGVGGDIDCDFVASAPPIPVPAATPSPTMAPQAAPTMVPGVTSAPLVEGEASVGVATLAPVMAVTPAPTAAPAIAMEPCEVGAAGDTTGDSTLCVDISSPTDLANGIGTYYEANCEGLGCDIAGNVDCRQCIFDETAYAASGATDALVECPCCVPVTYQLRPESSECTWPATPSPITVEGSGGSRPVIPAAVASAVGIIGGLLSLAPLLWTS